MSVLRCVLTLTLMCGAAAARAADWPQYRADSSRSASIEAGLPSGLSLRWMRRLPTPRPAFPGEVRLRFDATYEPVVAGGTVFVPSMVDDSVAALDVATGAERWRFFAEGPVRFAPVAFEDSVCFVSDDGNLYCLAAADGALRWKFRGAEAGKPERKLLGSGRLISLFPARGGPVLHEGVIYFGAGIWNGYGVAVHAVDVRTGKALWSNVDSNRIPKANMDHGVAHEAGISPHGYLAVVNDTLVVPCGAQLPAFLDRKTGKVQTYTMGWGGRNGLPKGTWFVAGTRNYLCSSGDLYDLTRPNDERFDDPKARNQFKGMLYPGGVTRVDIDPTNQKDLGAFQEPVFTSDTLYTGDGGLAAYDLNDAKLEARKSRPVPPTRLGDTYPDRWTLARRELWRVPSRLRLLAKAGPHLYLGGEGVVEAWAAASPGETPRSVWRAKLEGTPHRVIAAADTLFVVTREGSLLAYGAQKTASPIVHAAPADAAPAPDDWTRTAGEVLKAAGVREGFALVLGIGSGRLAEEIVRQSPMDAIAVDADAAKVDRLRRTLDRAGLYGTRASAHVGSPTSYPLPPYLASLVVCEDAAALGDLTDGHSIAAIYHSLRPYGGTACLALESAARDALAAKVRDGALPGAALKTVGKWTLLSREGALAGAAGWTHAEADAANSGASEDRWIRAPMDLLWFDTPPRWIRTPGATLVRVCGGRMFLLAQTLDAVDVFTGRSLWKAELPFRHSEQDQLVAVDDAVYAAGGKMCVSIDPASGNTRRSFDLPEGLADPWRNLRVVGERLIASSGKTLLCLDRSTGKLAWRYTCGQGNLSVACGGGKVFVSEMPIAPLTGEPRPTKTHAVDMTTGKPLWQIDGGSEVRYSAALDRVVLESGIYDGGGKLVAEFPKPAKPPKTNAARPVPLFLVGEKALVGTAERYVEFDLKTGKALGKPMAWTRRGCTVPRASTHMVTTRVRGNAACIDIASRQIVTFWNIRAACSNNLFPADGVLNMPSLTGGCTCNYLPVSQVYVPAAVIPRNAP